MATTVAPSTRAVIEHHIDALMRRDVGGLVDGYADDALFLGNMAGQPIRGRAALREFWTRALDVFTPEVLMQLRFGSQQFEEGVGYLVWSAGEALPFGSDTFVVRDGRIAIQTASVQFRPF